MVKTWLSFWPRPVARWGAVSPDLTSGGTGALTVRLCACAWFLVLSVASFRAVSVQIADIAAGRASLGTAWPSLLSEGCIVLFYTIISCVMLLRPEPISWAKGLVPTMLALAGTYGAWLIPLLPRGPELPALDAASAVILVSSEVLMLYTLLTLGRSFSLTPQARKLVTNGPYAIVRHPLYLVEEAAITGVLLQYTWFAALPFLVLHISVQIQRIQIEEEVLRKAFPEYAGYARRTRCLIPGVW